MPMMTNTGELATMKPEDLEKFATSPAFQESSRYGAYGFTFPLQKVLQAYKQQCCFGHAPIMRAFRTQRINEEVMYVVLVHRPWDEWRYSDTPRLTDTPNPVCAYRNGHIIWRARAMCKTHKWGLNYSNPLKLIKKANPKDYVWDHVSVALDVGYQVLRFNYYDLGYSLKFCSRRESFIGRTYDEPRERDNLVRRLWPTCPALEQSAQVEEMGRLFQNFVL